jgi:alkanesulfonate monooxygenase SsuD/methylene tetrahydromethanopterin reductase-like flavin-dependent oxidoreductase (luciferase family)
VTRFGVSLPGGGATGAGLAPTAIADAARQIEAVGFDSAWVFDAIGRGWLLPDPLTALAIAGTVTTRIELGTGILQVPLRNPVELAQRALTTHLTSGGRLRLGVGSGSTAGDFAALGLDFASRFRVLDQSLTTMKKLWNGEKIGEASLAPVWPAALGGPPILVGSWAGSKWIVRAAKEFDGWVGSGARSTWGLGGKRAVVTNVVVDLDQKTASPSGPDDPFDLKCPREIARERLHHLVTLGFDDVVMVVRRHDAAYLKELRELALSAR